MSVTDPTTIQIKGPDGIGTFIINPGDDLVSIKLQGRVKRFKKSDVWGVAFVLANKAQQDQMLAVKKEEMIKYQKKHSVRLRHDMKAGECVNIICDVDVKKTVVDGIEKEVAKLSTVVPVTSN